MTIEYIPYKNRPDIRFEFSIEEIDAYCAAHIARLEAAPENHSPHKQIVREHREQIQHLLAIQAEVRRVITAGEEGNAVFAFASRGRPSQLAANMLEYGVGLAICPDCEAVYPAKQLVMYDWTHGEHAGRLFTCPQDHEVFRSFERVGELINPIPPFERELWERR